MQPNTWDPENRDVDIGVEQDHGGVVGVPVGGLDTDGLAAGDDVGVGDHVVAAQWPRRARLNAAAAAQHLGGDLLGGADPRGVDIGGDGDRTEEGGGQAGEGIGEALPAEEGLQRAEKRRGARRDPKMKILPAVERELVIQALKESNGNQVHAAKLLGITRATLRKRVEKFGIQRELNIK